MIEQDGFLEFTTDATLSFNPREGGVELFDDGLALPNIFDNKEIPTGQNYVISLGDRDLRLKLHAQPFNQGHNLYITCGALKINLYLESSGLELLDRVRQGEPEIWTGVEAHARIDLNLGPTGVKEQLSEDLEIPERDDGTTDAGSNKRLRSYQLELANCPYPVTLRQSKRDQDVYFLDLQLPALQVSVELEPEEHQPLLKILQQS